MHTTAIREGAYRLFVLLNIILIVSVTVTVSVKLTSSVLAGGAEGRSSDQIEGIEGCMVKSGANVND
jgi:hypothetical protein